MLRFGYTCERIRVYAGGHTMYILYAVNLKEMGKEKKYMTWVWGRKAGSLEEAIRSQANLKQLKEHLKDIWELYQWLIFKYSILSLSLSLSQWVRETLLWFIPWLTPPVLSFIYVAYDIQCSPWKVSWPSKFPFWFSTVLSESLDESLVDSSYSGSLADNDYEEGVVTHVVHVLHLQETTSTQTLKFTGILHVS